MSLRSNGNRSPRLVAVVAPNGLGHAKRVLSVLSRLAVLVPNVELDIVCERWQLEQLQAGPGLARLEARVTLHPGVVAPGVVLADADRFSDGRLMAWRSRLAGLAALQLADRVVSDNLAGVLALRSDAILMGSFLWSDVLEARHPGQREVKEFVDDERALLTAFRPSMLCVGAIAMPGVLRRTRAVPLDWMCEPATGAPTTATAASRRPVVGVSAGASGVVDERFRGIVASLVARGDWTIRADRHLAAGVPGAHVLHHQQDPDEPLDVMICRPGLGTVTDCIGRGVPMVLAPERDNLEIQHSAVRLERLGLGVTVDLDDREAVVGAAASILHTATGDRIRRALRKVPRSGVDQAAVWLARRMRRPSR